MEYEAVIGLEIHLELKTKSKLFCGCSAEFGAAPNSNCCPVCLGLPGSLPVFNRRAIELAVTAALSLNSSVQYKSRFDRKNYFYPDLPKAYQVSQYDQPLGRGGYLEFKLDGAVKKVSLERVHLEEEAGKLVHAGDSILEAEYSLVDYNRAGIPLLEIVTAPQIYSGREARLFLEELRSVLLYSGASDCRMEEGSLRCDANISLRPKGTDPLGTKAEVKNMNSFRAVEQALNYEAGRQAAILESGGKIAQETCHWDEEAKVTMPLRGKEGSSDYRYFPEPDLMPLILEQPFIEAVSATIPELPGAKRERLQKQYSLSAEEAILLTSDRELADFFERAASTYSGYNNLVKWIQGDLLFQLRERGRLVNQIDPALLVELLNLLDSGQINRPVAKELLADLVSEGLSPVRAVREKELSLISGKESLVPLIEQIVEENPDAVNNYRQGKEKALKFLVGRVMSLTRGRADPGEVNRLLKEILARG